MPLRVAEGNQPHLLVVDDEADRGAFIADVAQLVWWDTATTTDISLNLSPEDRDPRRQRAVVTGRLQPPDAPYQNIQRFFTLVRLTMIGIPLAVLKHEEENAQWHVF